MIFSHNWEGEPHNSPSVKRMMNPEDPYYTHEWMGEPHSSPSIRREVWPGDPEYTYAWEGEVGMSPSLKYRDGELVAKNISNAPAKVNDEYSSVAVEYTQEQFTYMSMIETQEGSTPYVGLTRMVVTPGEYFASGVDFRWGEGVGRVRHQIQFRGPNNESIGAPQIQRDFSDWPEGGRSIFVERVPDGATEARIYTWFYLEGAFTPAPAGSTVHVGGYVNAVGTSEKDVREQVENPFDGDTKSHRGRIVATNLVPNPASRSMDDYHSTTNTHVEFRERANLFPELDGRIDNQAFYFEAIDSEEGSVYASQTDQNSVSFIKGYWYAASVWVHTIEDGSLTQPHRFNIQFRDSTISLWSSRLAETYPSGMQRVELSGYVDVDDARTWWVFWPSDLRRAMGDGVYLAATAISGPSNSEDEALDQVRYFFDGDSPAEYGEVVAKNLFLNPRTMPDNSEFWGGQRTVKDYIIDDELNAEVLSLKVVPFEEPEAYTILMSPSVDIGESVEYVSWGIDFRLFSGFTLLAARPSYRNSEGVRRYDSTTAFSIGEWGRHVVASKVPEGSYDYCLYLYLTPDGSLSPAPHPQTEIRLTNASFSYADTEEEALRKVEIYFDGDTKDYALAKPKIWLTNRWVPFTPTHFL